MSDILRVMIKIWDVNTMDWLGYDNLDKYIFLNNILKKVNEQKMFTTKEQLEQIRYVLKEFQNEYEGKKSSREKDIIKKEYILS